MSDKPILLLFGDSYAAAGAATKKHKFKNQYQTWRGGAETKRPYIDILSEDLLDDQYDVQVFGFGGMGWWYSRAMLCNQFKHDPTFFDRIEIVISAHTGIKRLPYSPGVEYNSDLDNALRKKMFKCRFDTEFFDWAHLHWAREFSDMFKDKMMINFFCYDPKDINADLFTNGMNCTTPLIHLSVAELEGTKKETDHRICNDKRVSHFSTENHPIFAEVCHWAIKNYKPNTQFDFPMDKWHVKNPNYANWEEYDDKGNPLQYWTK